MLCDVRIGFFSLHAPSKPPGHSLVHMRAVQMLPLPRNEVHQIYHNRRCREKNKKPETSCPFTPLSSFFPRPPGRDRSQKYRHNQS